MPAAAKITSTRVLEEAFELGAIERAEAPDGGAGQSWFRYTITQGPNTITGYRQGSQRAVSKAIKEIVFELNERRNGKKGRVHLTPSRKPKKKLNN
jgi:hypothetical protein